MIRVIVLFELLMYYIIKKSRRYNCSKHVEWSCTIQRYRLRDGGYRCNLALSSTLSFAALSHAPVLTIQYSFRDRWTLALLLSSPSLYSQMLPLRYTYSEMHSLTHTHDELFVAQN